MKKIIPFKKDLFFDENIFEITSISLDHSLKQKDLLIEGEFNINGEYKVSEISANKKDFKFDIPFTINIDDKYENNEVDIDIDDFYYEIVDNKILNVNIDVSIDNLKERCIEEEIENNIEKEEIKEVKEEKTKKEYNSYIVHIVREDETINTIIDKYQTTKEQLELYNDLTEIKIGNKIIIPC